MEFILPIAHYRRRKGVRHGSLNEYDISKPITTKVSQKLQEAGFKVHLIDNKTVSQKAEIINNEIVLNSNQECLCVEFHFNSVGASGTCILIGHEGTADDAPDVDNLDKELAEILLKSLSDDLQRGIHSKNWKGLIPLPSSYRNSKLVITNTLDCVGLLVEFDSIDNGQWFIDNEDKVVQACFDALVKVSNYFEENY